MSHEKDIESSIDISGIIPVSLNKLKVEYTISNYNPIEKKYIDVKQETILDPRNSALVIIDVWEREFLEPMILNFINPLIKQLSGYGMRIIYAPSQMKQNKKLLIIDEGVTFYHVDIMDSYLFHHKIENLFYVGSDAFYCIIDKPNGIFSYGLRDHDKKAKIFLFEEGVISFTKEMKQTSLSLLKKNNIGIVKSSHDIYNETFPRITLKDPLINTVNQTESGNSFVIIFKNDFKDKVLNDFENSLKEKNINFGIVYTEKLIYENQNLSDVSQFIGLLKKLKIQYIYYCGYYLNNEILWSEFGITLLYIKKRYCGLQDLPIIYVINDLSYVIPSDSIDPEIEKAVVINHYRGIGNILSKTLLDGVNRRVKIAKNKYFSIFKALYLNIKSAIGKSLIQHHIEPKKVKLYSFIFSLIFILLISIFIIT